MPIITSTELQQLLELLRPISHNSTDDPRGQADAAIALLQAKLSGPEQKLEEEAARAIQQLETERGQALAASRWGTDVCGQALEDIKNVTAEHAALLADAKLVRKLLCAVYAKHPYMDDGEAQDSETQPFIDFIRDPASVIQVKMQERGLRKLAEASTLSDSEMLDWIECRAMNGNIEIARSIMKTGYEFGIHERPGNSVMVKIGTLRQALSSAIKEFK